MNTPFLTWSIVVAVLLVMLAANFIMNVRRHNRTRLHSTRHRQHRQAVIGIGSESEELFLPGDPLYDHPADD